MSNPPAPLPEGFECRCTVLPFPHRHPLSEGDRQIETETWIDAMRRVAEACLDWTKDTGGCHFCGYGEIGHEGAHEHDCPLLPYSALRSGAGS